MSIAFPDHIASKRFSVLKCQPTFKMQIPNDSGVENCTYRLSTEIFTWKQRLSSSRRRCCSGWSRIPKLLTFRIVNGNASFIRQSRKSFLAHTMRTPMHTIRNRDITRNVVICTRVSTRLIIQPFA